MKLIPNEKEFFDKLDHYGFAPVRIDRWDDLTEIVPKVAEKVEKKTGRPAEVFVLSSETLEVHLKIDEAKAVASS